MSLKVQVTQALFLTLNNSDADEFALWMLTEEIKPDIELEFNQTLRLVDLVFFESNPRYTDVYYYVNRYR